MSATAFRYGLGLILSTLLAAAAAADTPPPQKAPAAPKTDAGSQRISGPFTHENLTLFLIHGEDRIKNKDFLTLQEALKKKKVIVHETQQVNELAIENVSQEEVFVQAGDIVKGGQQDRVIAYDLIVPPKSGRIPLEAFCVESARWQPRGQESGKAFEISNQQAATKELKKAVRADMSQTGVWQNVDSFQKKLQRNAAIGALTTPSPTSLQLTLEDKKLEKAVNAYLKKLGPIVQGQNDAIGYAVAVNGAIESADVYASHSLFLKVWPTLLKGSAVEALAENGSGLAGQGFAPALNPAGGQAAGAPVVGGLGIGGLGFGGGMYGLQGRAGGIGGGGLGLSGANPGNGLAGQKKDQPPKPVTAAAVLSFLTDAEKGQAAQMDVTNRVGLLRRETPKASLFISQDKGAAGRPVLLRASYLAH